MTAPSKKVKDPTAFLRTESQRTIPLTPGQTRKRALRLAEDYMRDRGAFDRWSGQKVKFVPIVERLPWNPKAPARVVAFAVTECVAGGWQDGERIARVPVPHWDYDGCTSEAREAWELAEINHKFDYQAMRREQDSDHSWGIGVEVDNLEAVECLRADGNACASQADARQTFIDRWIETKGQPT